VAVIDFTMKSGVLDRSDFRATLASWINSSGEALVYIHHPHSAGGGTLYLVKSADDVEALLSRAEADSARYVAGQACVTAFRSGFYPLRGTVDEEFIIKIREAWPGDRWYSIAELTKCYPDQLSILGSGNTGQELESELASLLTENRGRLVGFGEILSTTRTGSHDTTSRRLSPNS
jgi:hypothetical protein